MKSSDSFKLSLPKSFLIIGSPGTAKTTLALQLPKPFILDCDRNMDGPVRYLQSIGKKLSFKYDTPFEDKSGNPTRREDRMTRAVELLTEALNDPEVETVIIDSLTAFVQLVFIQVYVSQKKSLPPETDFSKLDPKFEFAEWGAFLQLMNRTIFWLKGTGKRIVFTGHIKVDKDELSGSLFNFLNVPGQIRDTFSGYFEEVWQCYLESKPGSTQVIRKVRTVPDARSQNLGLKTACGLDSSFDANMDEIMKKLNPK